ncbi:MAG: hypothetical protein HQM04_06600 [Magnetococcales bacterium]|nr:hypothetical protein [Magnetococcales bacterium]MBF0114697.1 hypothetical protein [Magnetococcales bacterium]
MPLTPDEARSKWCCQARHTAVEQADRKIVIPCIAHGCMAWRWSDEHKKHGYCGLAGTMIGGDA